MKQRHTGLRLIVVLVIAAGSVSGCGGYAQQSNSGSGVQVYGTVDAGISHGTR